MRARTHARMHTHTHMVMEGRLWLVVIPLLLSCECCLEVDLVSTNLCKNKNKNKEYDQHAIVGR